MYFRFTEEQEMIREMAREFLAKECSRELIHRMAEDERGYTPELWEKMAELGWMGLSLPEQYGGQGDFLDLSLILEEMGRSCLPGPFFSTVVLGGSTLLEAASEEQKRELLPDLACGRLLLTLALTEPSVAYAPGGVKVRAASSGGEFTIEGVKLFIPDAHVSDYLICVARTGDTSHPGEGITLFLLDSGSPGIGIELLKTSIGDRQCAVTFDKVRVARENVLGQVDKGWPPVQKALEKATAARCAEMVGGAQQVLDMTVAYAKERLAFERPIGIFQAVQHRLADMLTEIDGSRLITYEAAWRLNAGLPASTEVAMAKAWISQVFRRAATAAHQLHGAVGFTADHDLHLYFKRAKAWEISLGDANFHLDRIATGFGL